MKIMGIDPGTIRLGYASLEYEDGVFEEGFVWDIITAPAVWRRSKRLHAIFVRLGALVTEFEPDVIAVETPFVGRNVSTALAIGESLGSIKIIAEMHRVRLAYYSPMEVKKAVTGQGNADKVAVAKMVLAILGRDEPVTEIKLDATDALAVAICHANRRDEAAILQRVDRP